MVALLTSKVIYVSFTKSCGFRPFLTHGRLTSRVVAREDEWPCSAMQLRAGVEDELVRRLSGVGHCAGHVVGWTVDDVVSEEVLALPESAIVRFERIELVQPVEEGLFGDGEEGLEIFLCTFGGCYALVAVVVTFLGRV